MPFPVLDPELEEWKTKLRRANDTHSDLMKCLNEAEAKLIEVKNSNEGYSQDLEEENPDELRRLEVARKTMLEAQDRLEKKFADLTEIKNKELTIYSRFRKRYEKMRAEHTDFKTEVRQLKVNLRKRKEDISGKVTVSIASNAAQITSLEEEIRLMKLRLEVRAKWYKNSEEGHTESGRRTSEDEVAIEEEPQNAKRCKQGQSGD